MINRSKSIYQNCSKEGILSEPVSLVAKSLFLFIVFLSTMDARCILGLNRVLYDRYVYLPITSVGILIITLFVLYKDRSIRIPYSKIDIVVTVYFIFNIFMSIVGKDSLAGTEFYPAEAMLTYILIRLMIFTGLISAKFVLISLYVVCSIQSGYAILQKAAVLPIYNRYDLPSGSLDNPAQLAMFIATVAGLAYSFGIGVSSFKSDNNRPMRIGSGITFILAVTALPFTLSRTSLLSLVFFIVIITAYRFKHIISERLSSSLRRAFGMFMILGFGFLLWFFYSFKKDSADGRWLIWKVSAGMISDMPLLGYGSRSFDNHYMKYQASYFRNKNILQREAFLSDEVSYAYNEYLQIIIENGVLGFAVVILLLVLARYTFYTATGALIIIPLACSMSSYPFRVPCVFLCFIIGIGLVSARSTRIVNLSFNKRIGLAVMAIVFTIALLTEVSNITLNAKRAHYAHKLYSAGFYTSAVDRYRELDSIRAILDPETLAYFGKSLALAGKQPEALRIYERISRLSVNYYSVINHGLCFEDLGRYHDAEIKYRFAADMLPNRLYPKYLLFQLYKKLNRLDMAKNEAMKILGVQDKQSTYASTEIRENITYFLRNNNF